jgi:hypothetical protein
VPGAAGSGDVIDGSEIGAAARQQPSRRHDGGNRLMKSRIRGREATWAAVHMAERRPIPLQATDVVGPHLPVPDAGGPRKRPPRVRKPSAGHDVIVAPTDDLAAHRADLRRAFGETLSDQFVEVMMGKLISGLRPNPFDVLEEATLNAAIAVIGSVETTSELQAFLATQAVIAGFSGLRMMELSQRHLGEENIAVYGGYASRLFRLQNELIETLNRHRRGNSQTVNVRHVHIHQGDRGVVGVVNTHKGDAEGDDEK